MKKNIIFLLFLLILCGCGKQNQDVTSDSNYETSDETTTDTKEEETSRPKIQLKLSKMDKAASEYSSFTNYWNNEIAKYPYVSYDDIVAGKYANHYVLIDGIIGKLEFDTYTELDAKYVFCDIYYKSKNGYILLSDQFIKYTDNIRFEKVEDLQTGYKVQFCSHLKSDGSFDDEILSLKILDTDKIDTSTLSLKNENGNKSEKKTSSNKSSKKKTPANKPSKKKLLKITLAGKYGIVYRGDVPQDVTGNWRWSTADAKKTSVEKYAVEYYKTYFKSDNEIHAIINKTQKTTTSIKMLMENTLDVTTYSYVSGEEHSAKEMFCGNLLSESWVHTDTGKIEKIQ